MDSFVVSPVGSSGGLALLWKDSVFVEVLTHSKNFVDSVVTFTSKGIQCNITWLYGTPHNNEKVSFWYSMLHRFSSRNSPWLCLRDFNEILTVNEKWGGAPPLQWRMNLFQNVLSQTELRDLHFQGPMFTWFSMRQHQIYIKERLDRCLGNVHWCASYPNSQTFNLPKIGSDHRPILLDTNPLEIKASPLFHFEHTWTTYEDCSSLVQANWHSSHFRTPMNQWSQNLYSCKKALQSVSKLH